MGSVSVTDTIYAQVLNGVVVNVIVLNDSSLTATFSKGFDYLVKISGLSPMPGIGMNYDGNVFSGQPTKAMPVTLPTVEYK